MAKKLPYQKQKHSNYKDCFNRKFRSKTTTTNLFLFFNLSFGDFGVSFLRSTSHNGDIWPDVFLSILHVEQTQSQILNFSL